MLYFVGVSTLLLMASYTIGTGCLTMLLAGQQLRDSDRRIAAIWLGVVILANTLLGTALALPLSPLVGATIASSLCALALRSSTVRSEWVKLWIQFYPNSFFVGLALSMSSAILTTAPVTWFDTGLYHYSLIQWLAAQGTVPGMALLFSNLGFTSSWFALSAPLNSLLLEARVSAVVNGFLLLLAMIHLCISVNQVLQRKAQLSDRFAIAFWVPMLLLTIGLPSLRTILVSPSPDISVNFLIGVTAWSILVVTTTISDAQEQTKRLDHCSIPLLLAIGAVSIKLIALPLLLGVGLFYSYRQRCSIRRLGLGIAMVGVLLAPLLINGIVTSGCPLYPSSLFCIDLPWSPTPRALQAAVQETHHFINQQSSSSSSEVISWVQALERWFQSNHQRQVMPLLTIASLLSSAWVSKACLQASIKQSTAAVGQVWICLIGAGGSLFILFNSPFFRFNVAYLLLAPALLGAVLYQRARTTSNATDTIHKVAWMTPKVSRWVTLLPLMTVVFLIVLYRPQLGDRLLLPPQMQTAITVTQQVNDIVYHVPQDGLCWATEIPCAFDVPPNVRLRSPERGLGGGFVRTK